jgi:hypothetical protein
LPLIEPIGLIIMKMAEVFVAIGGAGRLKGVLPGYKITEKWQPDMKQNSAIGLAISYLQQAT